MCPRARRSVGLLCQEGRSQVTAFPHRPSMISPIQLPAQLTHILYSFFRKKKCVELKKLRREDVLPCWGSLFRKKGTPG